MLLSSAEERCSGAKDPSEKVLMSDGVQFSLVLEELMKRKECCRLDMKSGSKGVRSWSPESELWVR
jgi:hypothetical protein